MTEANTLAAESCLTANQSGEEDPTALSGGQLAEALAQTAIDSATSELMDAMGMPIADAVGQPRIFRSLQCRGATAMARGKNNIDSIVLHTPEGYVPGTLSVLSGTRAGFDFFLPPSGELYKCNDYLRYFSWQAGDLAYNRRSIGIEQWDFARNMPNAPDAHYQRLARLCAYLVETLDLAIRHAKRYGDYGFIAHATITPRDRWDPGQFNYEKLLSFVSDLVKGRPDPTKPAPEKPGKTLHRVKVAAGVPKGKQLGAYEVEANAKGHVSTLKKYGIETTIEKGTA